MNSFAKDLCESFLRVLNVHQTHGKFAGGSRTDGIEMQIGCNADNSSEWDVEQMLSWDDEQ